MNILIEIGHPAHVHKLAGSIKILKDNNHKIIVITKNIASVEILLKKYEIPYKIIGIKKDSLIGKGIMQLWYNLRCLLIIQQENIDFMIGSLSAAYMTRFTKIPSVLFDDDDDEVEPLIVKYVHPYVSTIVSPTALLGKRSRKDTIYYSGYHELAYLHPNRFSPDVSVLAELGLKVGEPYFILRFNAFKAHHDIGIHGLSLENKRCLIHFLEKKGKVFITTERFIDEEFKKYQLKLSPEKVHSLIYFATLLIGDSQTMTSEAAVLGTPSIRSNSFVGQISYLEEEEHKYGLTYGFLPDNFIAMKDKIDTLLSIPNLKEVWQEKRQVMLNDKIDVTAFYVWFIENYPKSVTVMKENPEYQNVFN